MYETITSLGTNPFYSHNFEVRLKKQSVHVTTAVIGAIAVIIAALIGKLPSCDSKVTDIPQVSITFHGEPGFDNGPAERDEAESDNGMPVEKLESIPQEFVQRHAPQKEFPEKTNILGLSWLRVPKGCFYLADILSLSTQVAPIEPTKVCTDGFSISKAPISFEKYNQWAREFGLTSARTDDGQTAFSARGISLLDIADLLKHLNKGELNRKFSLPTEAQLYIALSKGMISTVSKEWTCSLFDASFSERRLKSCVTDGFAPSSYLSTVSFDSVPSNGFDRGLEKPSARNHDLAFRLVLNENLQ